MALAPEGVGSCVVTLPVPPAMLSSDHCWTPESSPSPILQSSIPFLLPPIALSKCGKQQLPSLSTQLSCPVQLGLGLIIPVIDRKARLTRRMEKRKCAEKARRDALKETMDQVRALLPSKGKGKRLSKEALMEGAYEYVVELQNQASAKAELAQRVETEIQTLKGSLGMV
ncbi:hypothetical protein BC830DRAFT_1082166 [Chytriomyces sp. MP71]|nr:hypothetical protein BC830DRAFT_1082166 [Chytriomyces sp. MP71]